MTLPTFNPRFLAQLAHDLRSPLNVVTSTLADLMGEPADLSPADRTLMLTLSQRAVGRLVGLADRLSLASRIGNGLEATLQPVDLVALTRDTLATFVTAELRRRIEVDTTWPATPVMVSADLQLLPMLLRELFSNANRHARRQFRIEVLAPQPGVRVDDDGGGIAPDEQPLIFEPFAERRSRTGMGMGLWLARGLAEIQRGTLVVEHLAPGTRQLLQLPVLA
ncbi:MAG: putative two-component sensor kinase [Myxococcaceae bacterium]|nr:putative two-component sensor kinase [Myxococcaceae bacterium]